MALSLNTIKPAKGSVRAKKRVARGNASGTGTTGGRGQKGQKSRSGVGGLKRLGMRSVLLNIPKMKGFKSLKPKAQVINLDDLNQKFKDGDMINPKELYKKGMISNLSGAVKILNRGELKLKNITLESGMLFSASAKESIEKAGGKIVESKK